MTNVVRPCRSDRRPSWIIASLSLSRLDVASSSSRMRGFARIARAMATRWRWPPDSRTPRSPDHRVVAHLEPFDEFVRVRDSADAFDIRTRRVRRAVPDVVGDGAVEEEVVLQHDAEMAAIVGQPQGHQIAAVHADDTPVRPVERHDEADERALARPGRSDQRRGRPGRRRERDVLQHRHAGVVLEPHVRRRRCRPRHRRRAHGSRRRHPRAWRSRISRMRSSPANASLICVPIDAICTIGAAISPVKSM